MENYSILFILLDICTWLEMMYVMQVVKNFNIKNYLF